MKKYTIIIITLCAMVSNNVNAQSKFYIGLSSGYALGSNKTILQESYSEYYDFDQDKGTSTSKGIAYSFGEGLSFGGALGYKLNQKISLEIGGSYLMSKTLKYQETSNYFSTEFDYKEYENEENKVKSTMLKLIPTLVYNLNNNKLAPYAKLGLIVGFGKLTNTNFESYIYKDGYYYVEEESGSRTMVSEANGGLAIGILSTFGANFNLSNRLAIFGELNLTSLSYAPLKDKVSKYDFDGVSYLHKLETADRETIYSDKYTYDDKMNDPNQPDQDLKVNLPFSSLGLNFGVKFTF